MDILQNDYAYNTSYDSTGVAILYIYLIMFAVFFLFYVISYVFKGIGMYTMAKRQGMEYPWLAFIPFARTYLHGELGGNVTLKTKSVKNPGIWLLAMPFIFGVISFVFYMLFWLVGFGVFSSFMFNLEMNYGYGSQAVSSGLVLGIIVILLLWIVVSVIYQAVYNVLLVLVNHQIFEKFTSRNMSIAHGVLCIFIPLYEPFCFFVMRNRSFNPGMEPDLGTPFIQPGMPQTGGYTPEPYMPAVPVNTEAAVSTPSGSPVNNETVVNEPADTDVTVAIETPQVIIPPAPQDMPAEESKPDEEVKEESKQEEKE